MKWLKRTFPKAACLYWSFILILQKKKFDWAFTYNSRKTPENFAIQTQRFLLRFLCVRHQQDCPWDAKDLKNGPTFRRQRNCIQKFELWWPVWICRHNLELELHNSSSKIYKLRGPQTIDFLSDSTCHHSFPKQMSLALTLSSHSKLLSFCSSLAEPHSAFSLWFWLVRLFLTSAFFCVDLHFPNKILVNSTEVV